MTNISKESELLPPEFYKYTELINLQNQHPELFLDDTIDFAIDELFDIEYPAKKDSKSKTDVDKFKIEITNGKSNNWGTWVYYPWLNRVVHFPPVTELRALRTSRNRNLITSDEQLILYKSTIAVIGMSVGSNVVEALVSQGIGGKLILVDLDIIEPSNLNRIRAPYHNVGLHKVEAISRKIWEIDPYLEIIPFFNGITHENLEEIINNYSPNIIVDEMDDLRMKILLRESSKKSKIPVIMAADDGDNSLIDIDRYDIEEIEIFNSQIPDDILDKLKNDKLTRPEIGMAIGKYFVGLDNTPLRMFESLAQVGKTLPSWPQLGGAAALSGVVLAMVSRKILLGEKIQSGRTLVEIDSNIDLEHTQPDHIKKLEQIKNHLREMDRG